MISNQILQNTIEGIKSISKTELAVLDCEGNEVVSTGNLSKSFKGASVFAASMPDFAQANGYCYFKIFDEQQLEYILVVQDCENAILVGRMATLQLENLMTAYKERFDKDNFFKNLLLDNLLLVDIYSRARKLHIQAEAPRAVLLIENAGGKDNNVLELIRNFLQTSTKDFVTAVDESNVIIVKEVAEQNPIEDIEKTASAIKGLLSKEKKDNLRISYGTIVSEIKDVSRSYKEAKMALDVGKIFFDDRQVVAYSELGIGRLIYQLPIPLCKMFIKEIFDGKNPDEFDEDTLVTIYRFFENNLNVSETSRQLFIHRNTLVYRLDKLQKSTGLDLRMFEDAITFKIALMVVKYMKYMESFEY